MAAVPMDLDELGAVAGELLAEYRAQRPRLDRIASYMANKTQDIYVPRAANREYRRLVDQSRFNVLPLVVSTVAQALYVDGYRETAEDGMAVSSANAAIWDAVWQPNRMDARQAALYRAALTFGWSYAVVVPGDPAPVITPFSPRDAVALYDDDVNDEWPYAAMVVKRRRGADDFSRAEVRDGAKVTIYDTAHAYELTRTGSVWELDGDDAIAEHGLGVVPIVRFFDQLGDCLPAGKVEPLLPAQRQLNQTTFNLLMAQQYAAFRQRWVTGMAIPEDATGNPVEPWNAAVNRVWHAESADTKFGDFGEPLALDTPVPTPTGWTTIGEIAPGDDVIGRDGRPASVLGMSPVLLGRSCFRVTFADGTSVVTDAAHRWRVKDRFRPSWGEMVCTTGEMAQQVRLGGVRDGWRWAVPQAEPLDLKPAELPVHPYLLGYWLGDGAARNATVAVGEQDLDEIVAAVERCGYRVASSAQDPRTNVWNIRVGTVRPEHGTRVVYDGGCRCPECRALNATRARSRKRGETLADPGWSVQRNLRDLGVLGNKHIPPAYLRGSFEQRLDLLRGLLDSDGCVNRLASAAWCVFNNTNASLVEGFLELARSLGLRPTCHWRDAGTHRPIASVGFQAPGEFVPFALPRKAALCPTGPKSARQRYRAIVAIEETASVPVRCLAVDTADHLFLVGEGFVPTHNTNLGGYLESRDKTLLYIASVAQVPPHNLIIGSGISNISAEALVAISQGHRQDVAEHQTAFGESIEQLMRLAGKANDDETAWEDMSSEVVWRDTTPRSLAQVADALGKLATQLGIPVEELWPFLPGVTQQSLKRWKAARADSDLLGELSTMMGGAPDAADRSAAAAADVKEKADALGALIRAGADPVTAAAQVGLAGLEFTGAVPVSLRLPESEAADLESTT